MNNRQEPQNSDRKPQATDKSASLNGSKKPMPRILASLSKWLAKHERFSRETKDSVVDGLIDASNPDIDFFVLVFLACAIATFGLITNSATVIIGAMMISPLMYPILSLSMASITGHSRLFKQSIIAILKGVGLAVALSSLIAFLTYKLPLGALASVSNEVLLRTNPSLIDLLIALAGGAAAAYALAHPQLSAALPGVAISISLMPPLCTAGVGIALGQPSIIFGALLLYVTNLTAISFSAMLTFATMGFSPKRTSHNGKAARSVSVTLMLVLAISIPLGLFALNTLNEARIFNRARNAIIEGAASYTEAMLVDLKITSKGETKKVDAVLRTSRELSHAEVVALQSHIADRLQAAVALELVTIPMQVLDPLNPPTPTATNAPAHTATPTASPTNKPVPTATPNPTATPMPAFVAASGGAQVHDTPAGTVLFQLPQTAAVWVNAQSVQGVNTINWIEIRDIFGRSGWVNLDDLDIDLVRSN